MITPSRRLIATLVAGITAVATGASAMLVASPREPRPSRNAGAIGALLGARLAAPPPSSAAPASTATEDVEAAAIAVAVRTRAVPVRDGDAADESRWCAPARLRVSWTAPPAGTRYGAHIEPLGPFPGPDTTAVNGVVVCDGSNFAYMGFEALRAAGGWEILPVPDVGDDDTAHGPEAAGDTVDPGLKPKAAPPKASAGGTVPSAPAKNLTATIERYARYVAQDSCSPTAKTGVLAFRAMILKANPGTTSMGITRSCSAGGRSEHKEGRAWDWGVRASGSQRAVAQKVIDWLFATDSFGNDHAMARRLGIMYIVWDRKIWGAYRAGEGWRSYSGSNPHTDHVHFSFSRPGADAKTSFWTGVVSADPAAFGTPRGEGRFGDRNGTRDGRVVNDRDGRTPRSGDRVEWRSRTDENGRTSYEYRKDGGDWTRYEPRRREEQPRTRTEWRKRTDENGRVYYEYRRDGGDWTRYERRRRDRRDPSPSPSPSPSGATPAASASPSGSATPSPGPTPSGPAPSPSSSP